MIGMEQSLRYIEREIRFMVKDQFGNPTYAKYADRVVEDACGIPNFCSTVLSSKKPLTAILRAVRGPRGDVIMKFFNVSLHDARIEMVMVLAEAIKLRIHRNRTSRDAHEYLMKLYKKAIKRTVRLITGNKNKDSYKSMYRGLRDFAHMDDFDYEDDDDDDYFDDGTDFGDSEYADDCLEAYRNGEIPPEMKRSKPTLHATIGLGGNEEILKEIASIEAKIGRHLTDAELDELLCNDDDEDEIESDYPKTNVGNLSQESEDMVENITNIIYERLLKKFTGEDNTNPGIPTQFYGIKPNTGIKPSSEKDEDLEDFINRFSSTESNNDEIHEEQGAVMEDNEKNVLPVADGKQASKESHTNDESLETLVGMHNQLKNQVPKVDAVAEPARVEFVDIQSTATSDTDEDADESNMMPPDESSGGNGEHGEVMTNPEKFIAANTANHDPLSEHQMILSDIIRDLEKVERMNIILKEKISNYIYEIGNKVTDIFITLKPSKSPTALVTLAASVRITGDYEIIDTNRLNTLLVAHSFEIAETLGIDFKNDLIDIDFTIVDSARTFDEELAPLNVSCKGFTSYFTHTINLALCAMQLYVFNRTKELIDIRFIHSIDDERLSLYFFNKDGSTIDGDVYDIISTEMQVEGIRNIIETEFEICNELYHCVSYHFGDDNDDFLTDLTNVLEHPAISDAIKKYSEETSNYIIKMLLETNKEGTIEISSGYARSDGSVVIDIINEILTSEEVSTDERKSIKNELIINGEYCMHLKDLISAISSNTDVNPYLAFKVWDNDTESEEEEISESTESATSNFGI